MFHTLFLVLCTAARASAEAEEHPSLANSNVLEIQSVTVRGKIHPVDGKSRVRLGVAPEDLFVYFDFLPNSGRTPIRLCGKLEGVDQDWDHGGGFMVFVIRFYSKNGDVIFNRQLKVSGHSAGWRNDLKTSSLTHRRETVIVPPGAARLLLAVSSAGPQTTEGVYLVSDLIVSQILADGAVHSLLQFSGNSVRAGETPDQTPVDWLRDGTSPGMAKVVEFGQGPPARGLAVFDDNPMAHAEWHTTLQTFPSLSPGDQLVLEWNEMYSIGDSAMHFTRYARLGPGEYRFRAREVDLLENPTGMEAAVTIIVPRPLWQRVWFWTALGCTTGSGLLVAARYANARRQRLETQRLERAHMLERERLRIARDIHDDLGARVTQISLVSAMARDQAATADEMRSDLEQISQMSRDLVTSLYETLWTVNPENDNLRELGNYLFQIVNDLCERGSCRCRSQIDELPSESSVSSSVRHNLCMVVKEAMHNVLKHARATEVNLSISFTDRALNIGIIDNGCGFDLSDSSKPGHGLANMKGRLSDIGGVCDIESLAGRGTTIRCTLPIHPSPNQVS